MVTTANPITLETYPLATGFGLDPNSFVEQMFSNGKIPTYPRSTVELIAQELAARSREFSDDGRSVAGQIAHETNFLRYTGDSQPYQYNFGGIGTTGGGVHGESYAVVSGGGVDVPASVKAGVLAMFTHRSAYMRGKKENWPVELQQYWGASHREKNVVAAGFAGTVHQQKDFGNGKWAVGPKYAEGITKAANLFRADTGGNGNGGGYMPKIAIGAGHRNTSGGNAREQAMAAPLTNTYVNTLRAHGFDVRCYTPNEGLGMYPGTLSQAVNEVNKWAAQGWVADVLAELHFQGLSGNSDAGRGFFVIYPDWTGDVDTDVTDVFAPIWAPEFGSRTGLPRYGNGTMSEKRTSVGAAGSRLGVFSTSSALKATTTRMIIEHGCHTCPSDYAIIDDGQQFYQNCADAFAVTIEKWFNTTPPAPTGPWEPSGPSGAANNQWNGNTYYLVGEFWQKFERMGVEFLPAYGLIASGMCVVPVDGTERYVQFTEKGALAAYPLGLPHGVPNTDPMLIRNLFSHERAAALAVAKERGYVSQDIP